MIGVYLDESGDLSFDFSKKGTSRYFVITLLITTDTFYSEKIVKTIHRSLRKKYQMHTSVLHASKEESSTISLVCQKINTEKHTIAYLILKKDSYKPKKSITAFNLYSYMTAELLQNFFRKMHVKTDDRIVFFLSKRETNKWRNSTQIHFLDQCLKKIHPSPILIKIKTPLEEKCLQLADIVSWSIFRKLEKNDPTYYQIFSKRILLNLPFKNDKPHMLF